MLFATLAELREPTGRSVGQGRVIEAERREVAERYRSVNGPCRWPFSFSLAARSCRLASETPRRERRER